VDEWRTNPGDRETGGMLDKLGKLFSNLMLFSNVLKFNDDKGKLEYLINGMKVFFANLKIDRYPGNLCIGNDNITKV